MQCEDCNMQWAPSNVQLQIAMFSMQTVMSGVQCAVCSIKCAECNYTLHHSVVGYVVLIALFEIANISVSLTSLLQTCGSISPALRALHLEYTTWPDITWLNAHNKKTHVIFI